MTTRRGNGNGEGGGLSMGCHAKNGLCDFVQFSLRFYLQIYVNESLKWLKLSVDFRPTIGNQSDLIIKNGLNS